VQNKTLQQQQQGSRSKRAGGEKMFPMGILAALAAVCAYFWWAAVMMFEAFAKLYVFGPVVAAFVLCHLPRWLIRWLLAFVFGM
jgi:hypothetical protein